LDRALPTTFLAEGFESVPTAQCEKQPALPRIGKSVEKLHIFFASGKLSEPRANPFRGAACGLALTVDGGSGVKRFDLPELLVDG
jgi:hypothetical protein